MLRARLGVRCRGVWIIPQVRRTHGVADVRTVGEIGGVGAGTAHAFDADQNYSRVNLFKLRPVESPLFQNTQAEVFHEHVGLFHQLTHEFAAFRRLHVDGERFLAALELHEVGFLVPELGVFAAMTVAAQSCLTANHFRAELAEHTRDRRPGGAGGQLDDTYSFKGKLAHKVLSYWSSG